LHVRSLYHETERRSEADAERYTTGVVGGGVPRVRRRYDGIALDVLLIAIDVVVVAGAAVLAIGYWW
jgi:hypothetical protein